MRKWTIAGSALACLLAAAAVPAAEKDKMVIDPKAAQPGSEAPNTRHQAMGALGVRVHGGAFGPWRCQVKMLDRRETNEKIEQSPKVVRTPTNFMLALSVIDPSKAKSVVEGSGSVTFSGPGLKKEKVALQAVGGAFLADVELPKAGEYEFAVEFSSGKQKASAKFSYVVR